MKLSIAWIFDHINADWRKQDMDYLISKFNSVSGEIEDFYKVKFDLKPFAIGRVLEISSGLIRLNIPEWKKEVELSGRLDASVGSLLMVVDNDNQIDIATLNDFNLVKDGLIPELYIKEKDLDGSWKKNFETEDIIIEVDNKSITNRPDMWGHRGFAREIAAFMDFEFLPADKFLENKEVFDYPKTAKSTNTNKFAIAIENAKACSRFSGIYFESIKNRPTDLFTLGRLLRVGTRPINMLVDLTNYLMLDWSQPVHAYDAKKIDGEKITARMAKKNEKLQLLDGSELELLQDDLVIADSKKVLGLAGVMGGLYSSIDKDTNSVFFESANFDPEVIRKTALRHKVRTDACLRFEKTLDKNQTSDAILRFLNLLKLHNVEFTVSDEVLSVGVPAQNLVIEVSHDFLEARLGIELQEYDITVSLTKIGFKVEVDNQKANTALTDDSTVNKESKKVYSITVPTFRSSKDISIKEDILEEVVRFYGFDKIDLKLPKMEKVPTKIDHIFRLRNLKNFLIDAAKMTEQQNYIFLNEPFLKSIDLKIEDTAASLLNPVSDDQVRLVNSLLPNLFKNIKENIAHQDSLRFFEFGRVWISGKKDELLEKRSLAGLFFEKKSEVNFYSCKAHITGLLDLIGLDFKAVDWNKIESSSNSWIMPYMSAKVVFDGKEIGTVGKVDPVFLAKLDVLPESDAFFFELDGDFLINFEAKVKKFSEISKYQDTFFDLSLIVPLNGKTIDIEGVLKNVSNLIYEVQLIDSFEKDDWIDKKSLTFRLYLRDLEKTIDKSQIGTVWKNAVKVLENQNIKLRM